MSFATQDFYATVNIFEHCVQKASRFKSDLCCCLTIINVWLAGHLRCDYPITALFIPKQDHMSKTSCVQVQSRNLSWTSNASRTRKSHTSRCPQGKGHTGQMVFGLYTGCIYQSCACRADFIITKATHFER